MSGKLKRAVQKTASKVMQTTVGCGSPNAGTREVEIGRVPTLKTLMSAASVKKIMEKEPGEHYENLDRIGNKPSAHQKSEEIRRVIRIRPEPHTPHPAFKGNSIKTAKYNVITFFPIFLFEMFSKVAYLYFLIQTGLSWWNEVSPFSGVGVTLALMFVLFVSGIKAALEDYKRHTEDNITNNTPTTIVVDLETGVTRTAKWKDLKVGQIVKVSDNELFPADLLCLKTALPDNVCYIRTTNLDGESNLKIRKPVDLRGLPGFFDGHKDVFNIPPAFQGCLYCEEPNRDLHRFRGRFEAGFKDGTSDGKVVPVTMNEMLLRGTVLKNSRHVFGLVVYAGCETRIQKNAARPPLKIGSFDRFLNIQIFAIISVQTILCVFLAVGSLVWREQEGKKRYYLAFDEFVAGNYRSNVTYLGLVFLTFWILTSYMVPISLFVTMEIVKFWQAFVFINNDPQMVDARDKTSHPRARNSNLNEDLGKVEYVFSDKTGTLTSNEMQLRMLAIKGMAVGNPECKLEELPPEKAGMDSLKLFDRRLAKSVGLLKEQNFWELLMHQGGSREEVLRHAGLAPELQPQKTLGKLAIRKELNDLADLQEEGYEGSRKAREVDSVLTAPGRVGSNEIEDCLFGWHIIDFWTNICICHSLIIEEEESEEGVRRVYQGPSPDEVALVEAGKQLGFEFCERTMSSVTLNFQDHLVHFDILNVLEFSSERKRMSVIARSQDGTIRLYCKGADNAILERLQKATDPKLQQLTQTHLYNFSVKGLRTLVLATRVLHPEEYQQWSEEYQQAAQSLENREAKIEQVADRIERDLEFVGVTAIEDKLQDGVPMAILTLRMADVKVWMITGDKMETAINIGVSCKLISHQESVTILVADTEAEARKNIQRCKESALAHVNKNETVELIVDGPSLVHILGKEYSGTNLEQELAELASLCGAVIICRSSPSQKAAIVKVMNDFEMRIAEGTGPGFLKWLRKQDKKIRSRSLAIGDGANDVAMIQAANVGIGLAGKEGRQAVNNSDYSISQFRFLVRLLLVHGQLSHYRIARLIKYSFYKNIAFAFILIYYQFFNGFSGQPLIDDISAAMYNVVFTSVPILLFALVDRPLSDESLIRFPQLYNRSQSLSTKVFWKSGILDGLLDATICFFIPVFAATPAGRDSTHGLWSVGKTAYVALLGAVTLEMALVTRYWTMVFFIFMLLSYFLVYPFFLIFPYAERLFDIFDPAQFGVAENLFATSSFWLTIVAVYAATFGYRYLSRTIKWLYYPDDNMIIAEFEKKCGPDGPLAGLGANEFEAQRMLQLGYGERVRVEESTQGIQGSKHTAKGVVPPEIKEQQA